MTSIVVRVVLGLEMCWRRPDICAALNLLRGLAIDFMVGVAPPSRINALDVVFYCILLRFKYTIK